jgi:two-component system cell cycle response regulator
MQVAASTSAELTAVLLWSGAGAAVLFAAVGGFAAGILCAPWFHEWAVRRASAHAHKMFALVIAELERAQRMCAELAAASGCALSPEEWQRMDRVRQKFQETFSRISSASGVEAKAPETGSVVVRPKEFTVEWTKAPVDTSSGLPNLQAFEQNLAAMLAQGSEAQLESGLLLVRMDKVDSLRRRLGHDAVEKLLSRLVSVVVRTARDQDLVCRLGADTLALLCPALPPLAGSKLAEKIREAVRNHHFRVDEGGPEVLVTASFGYANAAPGDTADLVRDRAGDGLARSQALGRNQLHVHDGERRALCRSS